MKMVFNDAMERDSGPRKDHGGRKVCCEVFFKGTLIFHMVINILKFTCFRDTFKSIIVRRHIINEPR